MLLQVPKPFGIGRRNVYRYVVGDTVYRTQACQVVPPGVLISGGGITTEVNTDDRLLLVLAQPEQELIETLAVNTHPVNHCLRSA